uniref:HAD-IC family P-type ATPase n=1 Tax=Nocardia neocaledoniensis TaxID=236511 RepID=UPI002454ED45
AGEIVVVGPHRPELDARITQVREVPPGSGPVAAIGTGLTALGARPAPGVGGGGARRPVHTPPPRRPAPPPRPPPRGVPPRPPPPPPTSAAAVAALHDLGVDVVMLTGDNQATARRIAEDLGIDTVIAEVLPGDKADRVAELQQAGKKVAMVGDGVNDAPALARADLGIAIGAGTDVAIQTADVVLMRSDPFTVSTALRIGRGTVGKEHQNLAWAVGYNGLALPIAAGVFAPWGLTMRPEIAAMAMSGSSLIVALNALRLKRLPLPEAPDRQPAGDRRPAGARSTARLPLSGKSPR